MIRISEKDVNNLATLARIKMEPSEVAEIAKDLESILQYIDTIKKATTGGAGKQAERGQAASDFAVRNVVREDEARETVGEDRERLLSSAPKREGDFIAVKKIL